MSKKGEAIMRLCLILAFTALALMFAMEPVYGLTEARGMVVDEMRKLNLPGYLLVGTTRWPSVQKELRLSVEQKQKIDELHPQVGGVEFPYEEGLAQILIPEQMERLRQITLQSMGVDALKLPQIIKRLRITAEQQTKIEGIAKQANDDLKRISPNGAGLGPGEFQRTMAEYHKQVPKLLKKRTEDTIGVLTPEQRQKFEKMKGKPFDLKK
jgi:Spy/CpxP family protein refolding chaperone